MSEIPIPMSLPLDKDGFLRRECPNCERQFKWWPSSSSEETSEDVEGMDLNTMFEPIWDGHPASSVEKQAE